VLRFPRVRLNSHREFPALVLKLFKSDASADSATPAQEASFLHRAGMLTLQGAS
jgi:hypothetical protein